MCVCACGCVWMYVENPDDINRCDRDCMCVSIDLAVQVMNISIPILAGIGKGDMR